MTRRITVVPAPGRVVPDPESGGLLPPEGREVTDNAWWRRRLAAADITLKHNPNRSSKAAHTATEGEKS